MPHMPMIGGTTEGMGAVGTLAATSGSQMRSLATDHGDDVDTNGCVNVAGNVAVDGNGDASVDIDVEGIKIAAMWVAW